jgi:hypothetical protein
MKTRKNILWPLLALFAVASSHLMASADDDDRGGSGGSRYALTAELIPIPPTKGQGDGQYFELQGGDIEKVLNADVRLALEKLVEDSDPVLLNTHLGITVDNYDEAVITLFIGTDEDGDGTCLQEGPTSICVLETSGGDLEINPDGILHAAWALALRVEDDTLKGSGICWSNFESVEVIPQFDDDGNMTSIVFDVVGGEEAMPYIAEGDGSMVGFGADWLGFTEAIDCGADTTCEVIPIMMGQWNDYGH